MLKESTEIPFSLLTFRLRKKGGGEKTELLTIKKEIRITHHIKKKKNSMPK